MSKVDEIYKIIQNKIISGEWKAGTKISSENQLARELGVSRATIRGAIDKMVVMDILIKKQGDGTYVNSVKPEIFFNELFPNLVLNQYSNIDILEFRELIEPECVKLFIRNYDDGHVKELELCCEIMKHHDLGGESTEYALADLRFHMIIAKGCKNSILIKVMEILNDLLTSYQLQANKQIGPRTGTSEHIRILQAIKDKDYELAPLLMKRHIQRTKMDIINGIQ